MLPINFIAEILGADIKWVNEATGINITEDGILETASVEQPTVIPSVPAMKTSSAVESYVADSGSKVSYAYLEIDGVLIGFGMVSQSGGNLDKGSVEKSPSLTMQPERITLSRGTDNNYAVYNWISDIAVMGKLEKKTLTLILNNTDGTPRGVWKIENAWPTSVTFGDRFVPYEGGGIEILSLVLSYDKMTREK